MSDKFSPTEFPERRKTARSRKRLRPRKRRSPPLPGPRWRPAAARPARLSRWARAARRQSLRRRGSRGHPGWPWVSPPENMPRGANSSASAPRFPKPLCGKRGRPPHRAAAGPPHPPGIRLKHCHPRAGFGTEASECARSPHHIGT